jgi:hypothetical protein
MSPAQQAYEALKWWNLLSPSEQEKLAPELIEQWRLSNQSIVALWRKHNHG